LTKYLKILPQAWKNSPTTPWFLYLFHNYFIIGFFFFFPTTISEEGLPAQKFIFLSVFLFSFGVCVLFRIFMIFILAINIWQTKKTK
jgi:hypothetical protein